jgi:class 3 adenylate cyclase
MRVHEEAHGGLATDIIPVDLSAVEAFLGRISDPPQDPEAAPAIDAALRAVMFTDIVDSTGMTARLGDARAVEMVRSHDAIVRRALGDAGGREVKHTGDGIMASFADVAAAVECTCAIQRTLAAFNRDSAEPLQVRIGMHVGEPIEDSNDLFGATVQMAARICHHAAAGAILVSDAVRQELPRRFRLRSLRAAPSQGLLPAGRAPRGGLGLKGRPSVQYRAGSAPTSGFLRFCRRCWRRAAAAEAPLRHSRTGRTLTRNKNSNMLHVDECIPLE